MLSVCIKFDYMCLTDLIWFMALILHVYLINVMNKSDMFLKHDLPLNRGRISLKSRASKIVLALHKGL